MLAGAQIELEAVPRANDVLLRLREAHSEARLVRCDMLLDLGHDLALTDRAAHVRAVVLVGDEIAVEIEHCDLDAADLHHAMRLAVERRDRTEAYFRHC